MTKINELFDLDKTIAAKLFEGKTYPWEVLGGIKDFILALGETLPQDEYDHRSYWERSSNRSRWMRVMYSTSSSGSASSREAVSV